MRTHFRQLIMATLAATLAAGCAGGFAGLHRDKSDTFSRRSDSRTGAATGNDRLDADMLFLDSFAKEMSDVLLEASVLAQRGGGRAGFTPEELDRYAYLLFRFQLCRNGLWEVANDYTAAPHLFGRGRSCLPAQLIGLRTMMQISYSDSQFLLTFYDAEAARAALNRAYPLAEIESGTYNSILETALDPANLDARDAAWHFFANECDPQGAIARASEKDAIVRTLVESIGQYHTFGEASLERLLGKRGVVFPSLENRLRKSMEAGALKSAGEAGIGGLKALTHFSLLALKPLTHLPFATATEFTDEQRDLMQTLIHPGDILLTYTSGYLSSIFFPGVFKHGIVYVGTVLQRETLGLGKTGRISPRHHDLIEAVGKGVIWNDMEHIVSETVTLVAVLRPVLTSDQRRAYLQEVYDFLGRSYDLRFDFMSAQRLCCTEVIYHTLNERGTIQFPMVQRFGMPTLSADDILRYYLSKPDTAFELVFLGAPVLGASGHEGVVLTGVEAQSRLRDLLNVAP